MSQHDVTKVNQAPYCKQYMELVGYPTAPSNFNDFSQLRDPFAVPLTVIERKLLSDVRQESIASLR